MKVKAAQVNVSKTKLRELYAAVCWYYPQYTLKQAQDLPARDIKLLIRVAERKESANFYNMTQICAAPHSKKGAAVKKLMDYFKKKAEV